jgi:transposase InsO family protein
MVLPRDIDKYLTRRFFNPSLPGSFTSASKLHQVIKKENRYNISLNRVEEWAKTQDIVTLHRSAKEKQSKYKRIVTPGLLHLWDCDLLELSGERFTSVNEGHAYILLVIDVFSRYCYGEPVKTKGGTDIKRAFATIFDRAGEELARYTRSDRGAEFTNRIVQDFLKEKGITHYFTNTNTKSKYCEALN